MKNPKKLLVALVITSVSVFALGCKDTDINQGKNSQKEVIDAETNTLKPKLWIIL